MRFLSKSLILLLIISFAISGLSLSIKPTTAQTITKPSVPEFTVKYVDFSYDVPATYGIDQYTGKNVTINEGYHVDNRSIEFTIKNQQFTPYTDSNGNSIKVYYNFGFKGNYGDVWTYYPLDSNGRSVFHYGGIFVEVTPIAYVASNSTYTVLLLSSSLLGTGYRQTLPDGVQVNFQVQALVGYFVVNEYGYYILTGESSDWSSTQTVTIGETSTSPNPTPSPTNTISPTPTPTVPEFSWLALMPFSLVLLSVAIVLKIRRANYG
jgi:hypothetical protein